MNLLKKIFYDLKIISKINIFIILSILFVFYIFYFTYTHIESSISRERYAQASILVNAAFTYLDSIRTNVPGTNAGQASARAEAIARLQDMRFEHGGYFFIFDLKANVLAHPNPKFRGRSAMHLKDRDGKYVYRDMVALIREKGGGYYSYHWPPDATGRMKVSYVKYYPAWGLCIGTGVYTDNIRESLNAATNLLILSSVGCIFVFYLFAYLIKRSIADPIIRLSRNVQELADGKLDAEISDIGRKDEIGAMAQSVAVFQENLRRMEILKAEEHRTDSLQSEFVSVVSHELRTPFTAIRGALSLVESEKLGTLPPKAKNLISIANKNCERLVLLINDILDIDKIAAGKMQYDSKRESVLHLVTEAVTQNQSYADKYFVRYQIGDVPSDVCILVDASRFLQVMANFLSNAAKFSLNGARVDVYAEAADEAVRICVRDYGMGIPENFKTRIFKKFSQADSVLTRSRGGSGLGLYICKQIIEQMGGTIGYETQSGIGTTFWVRFPMA